MLEYLQNSTHDISSMSWNMVSRPSLQERVREVKPRLFLMFGFAFLRGWRSAYPYIPCIHSVLQ